MRFCGLCTLTGRIYIPHRTASTSDKFLIYEFEFPTFNTNQKQALANAFLLCHPLLLGKGCRKNKNNFFNHCFFCVFFQNTARQLLSLFLPLKQYESRIPIPHPPSSNAPASDLSLFLPNCYSIVLRLLFDIESNNN